MILECDTLKGRSIFLLSSKEIQKEGMIQGMKETGLYIHIPFCKQKCLYCDFPSFANQEDKQQAYVEALQKELVQKSAQCAGWKIKSVFFGGGTPTVLPISALRQLIQTVFRHYTVLPHAEITIEANPGTLDANTCQALYDMGFRRLSMGVQAWQDTLLQRLGRIHTRAEFLENYAHAREAGFTNINLDLMFALPKQTLADWIETLDAAIALHPEHISAYSLIVEEGTPFAQMYENGVYQPTEEDLDRQMYHIAIQKLAQAGYHQYEISNFAQTGKQSVHNQIYWQDDCYLGFGLGAHSYWDGARFHNSYDLDQYITLGKKGIFPQEEKEILTQAEAYAEFMFMGLRMTDGICKERFLERFGVSVSQIYGTQLQQLQVQGLLEETPTHYRLTPFGIDVSNQVFMAFLE